MFLSPFPVAKISVYRCLPEFCPILFSFQVDNFILNFISLKSNFIILYVLWTSDTFLVFYWDQLLKDLIMQTLLPPSNPTHFFKVEILMLSLIFFLPFSFFSSVNLFVSLWIWSPQLPLNSCHSLSSQRESLIIFYLHYCNRLLILLPVSSSDSHSYLPKA